MKPTDPDQCNDECVVITGAASGIGEALARLYVGRGARVAALDWDEEKLRGLPERLGAAAAGRLFCARADVTDEASLRAAAREAVMRLGRPDVWYNNAGISLLGAFDKIPADGFRRVVDVNFMGVVHGTRVALEWMRDPPRGVIVNMGSLTSDLPAPYMTSYVAAKHAVAGFTRALQQELAFADSPLRAVLVEPGFVQTPIMGPQKGEGGDFEFPKWLEFLVEQPDAVAREIVAGVDRGALEVHPTFHGKVLLGLNRLAPGWVRGSARALVARDWKQLLGLKPIRK